MTTYLDESLLPRFAADHFADVAAEPSRLAGRDRRHDCYYFDIVRFFGADSLSPASVRIVCDPGQFHLTDPAIRAFTEIIAGQLREEGRLYDGPLVVRVIRFERDSNGAVLTIQATSYAEQVSCLALDLPHHLFDAHGGTLRNYYKAVSPSCLPESNPLAICIGVCGYLLVQEREKRFLLQVQRSGKLVSLEHSWGPSVAGLVDFADDYCSLENMVHRAMMQEINEEIGLNPSESRVIPLAYAREMLRGERPQIFCLITTTLARSEVAARLDAIPTDKREYDAFHFLELSDGGSLPVDQLSCLNLEAQMNYYLIEEYLHREDLLVSPD